MFLLLYHAHPTWLLSAYHILPPVYPAVPSLLVKAEMQGKTGIYLGDSLYMNGAMLVCGIAVAIGRLCPGVNHKINPYLVSYAFRLMFMEVCLGLFLFLDRIELSDLRMRWSLVLLAVDVVAVAGTLFWRVRSDVELNHAHYALFYFN